MSNREEREHQRKASILPDGGVVAAEIFAMMATLEEPGATITPALAAVASQAAGAEAAGRWLTAGRSFEDCGMIRRFYEYVGNAIGEDVSPGGRLHGATLGDDSTNQSNDAPSSLVARGVRFEPALESDPVPLIATSGGFIDGGWQEFLGSPGSRRIDGTWVLNSYPAEDVLALQFMGRNYSGFVEVFSEDIASVHLAAKGLNLVAEVVDCNGARLTVVGPKGRLRKIFKQLGHPL